MPGNCPSVSVIDRPFRRDRSVHGGTRDDWDRFGYRVTRNSLLGQQEQSRIDPAGRVELACGVFTVTIDRRRLDAEATRDLLGVHVRMDEAKAFALAVGQSISSARHWWPPGLCPHLNPGFGFTETGMAPHSCNQRLSTSPGPIRRGSKSRWRPDRESNSGARICSPLRNHSAIRPWAVENDHAIARGVRYQIGLSPATHRPISAPDFRR